MSKKKSKPKLTDGLRPLKKVEGDLPYYFDMMWDIKRVEDIRWHLKDAHLNPHFTRKLAEYGYDVKSWVEDMVILKKQREELDD